MYAIRSYYDIEDKPRWLSESIPLLPLDSELATSTKRYLAFDRPKKYGGDWTGLLGHPCTLTVAHTKKGRAKVGSVTNHAKKNHTNSRCHFCGNGISYNFV